MPVRIQRQGSALLAALATGQAAALLRLLDTRPIRNLGLSSYSLYLIHAPIVVVVYEKVGAGRVAPGVPAFLVSLVLTLPLSMDLAWLFAAVFEIPFQRRRSSFWAARRPRAQAEGAPG
jgi:peptidoglycan/LPS O-acetylase OafA/YrhL